MWATHRQIWWDKWILEERINSSVKSVHAWESLTRRTSTKQINLAFFRQFLSIIKGILACSNKFMGKRFQAAQLTHERFLTLDHSSEIFFWHLPIWTFTKWSKSAKCNIGLPKLIFYVKKVWIFLKKNSLKNINSGPHF